jgi:hypothetical protein
LKNRINQYQDKQAPSDFHLFTHLKQFLDGTHMGSGKELEKDG